MAIPGVLDGTMSAQEYYQGGGQQQGPPPPQQQQQYSMQQSNPYAEQYKAPDGPPPQQHENWDYKNEKFAPMKPKCVASFPRDGQAR